MKQKSLINLTKERKEKNRNNFAKKKFEKS